MDCKTIFRLLQTVIGVNSNGCLNEQSCKRPPKIDGMPGSEMTDLTKKSYSLSILVSHEGFHTFSRFSFVP